MALSSLTRFNRRTKLPECLETAPENATERVVGGAHSRAERRNLLGNIPNILGVAALVYTLSATEANASAEAEPDQPPTPVDNLISQQRGTYPPHHACQRGEYDVVRHFVIRFNESWGTIDYCADTPGESKPRFKLFDTLNWYLPTECYTGAGSSRLARKLRDPSAHPVDPDVANFVEFCRFTFDEYDSSFKETSYGQLDDLPTPGQKYATPKISAEQYDILRRFTNRKRGEQCGLPDPDVSWCN